MSLYDQFVKQNDWSERGFRNLIDILCTNSCTDLIDSMYFLSDYSEEEYLKILNKFYTEGAKMNLNELMRLSITRSYRVVRHYNIIKWCIEKGADVNYVDNDPIGRIDSILCEAIRFKMPAHMILYLLQNGANPSPDKVYYSPLHLLMLCKGHLLDSSKIAKMLLDYGAILGPRELNEIKQCSWINTNENLFHITEDAHMITIPKGKFIYEIVSIIFKERYQKPRAARYIQAFIRERHLHPDYVWKTDPMQRTTAAILCGANRNNTDKIYKVLTKT